MRNALQLKSLKWEATYEEKAHTERFFMAAEENWCELWNVINSVQIRYTVKTVKKLRS
jgi:hypothetical protein